MEPIDTGDLMSDTWVATDALGRQMPLIDSVGQVKTDHVRATGIFYITWHGAGNHNLSGPYTDVTKILAEDPSARMDAKHPLWKYGGYHWGEPEMGYFLSQDEWVIRKDISMLQDAGIDVLVMDVTNGVCYWDEWELLFSTMMKMREEGNRTPQFVFWSYNNNPVNVVKSLYEKYYKEGKFSDLWYYWDGKPLLLYNADPSVDATGNFEAKASDYPPEIFDFFTLRNMWWGYYEWGKDHEHGPDRYIGTEDNWSFGYSMNDDRVSEMSPEGLASKHDGKVEECAVTPAQHPLGMKGLPMGVGKSWSKKTGEPPLNEYDMPVDGTSGEGIYFQERWEDALAVDPPFIYLNDWNEWTAGKYDFGGSWFLGRKNSHVIFVDQYNAEFNRTIQPMKDGYTDNYYMQMAQNIRRYKGVRPIPVNKGFGKISINGGFRDWDRIGVYYLDTRGDVTFRDADGYAGLHYTDSTGRNDIQESKVALTRNGKVCFYVRCGSPITSYSDPDWMLLLIDSDQDSSTGWYGYDFIVNKKVVDGKHTTVMSYSDGTWKEVATVSYKVSGNEMELAIPASILGVGGDFVSFDFKWADNVGELVDPISLCLHGDTAPNRRFNYRFIFDK
ncbi:MAG: hypothetical protein IKW99_06935 [Bacteroidales bacterium]|nr:hypothetical protein [Bacteroidales bacterium]